MSLLNQRYRKLEDLSSGGFGDTFLAEDTQMPSSRKCVIKQLRPVNHDPEFYQLVQQRFFREAVILETLGQHPQIPALYAYFEEDGLFYLVQEWTAGITLENLIQQQGALSPEFMIPFLVNLLTVLAYVHQQKIIHRDIKPANIILRQSDHSPVLIDFGAVKEIISSVGTNTGQHPQTIVIGTPGFIAPEQVQGRPCYASDLFSLGYTAIYALTGQDPRFSSQHTDSGQLEGWLQSISLPIGLREILERAILPHPSQRYQSALEMQQALLYASQPTNPIPPASAASLPSQTIQTPTVADAPVNSVVKSQDSTDFPKWFVGFGLVVFLLGGAIAAALLMFRPKDVPSSTVSLSTEEPDLTSPSTPSPVPKSMPHIGEPKFDSGDVVRVIDVSNDDFLAVLAAAGIQNKLVGCLPYDAETVKVIGENVTLDEAVWYPIQYLGLRGWVSGRYLALKTNRAVIPSIPPRPSQSINGQRRVIDISPNDDDPVLFILDQPGVRNTQGEVHRIVGCIPYDGTDVDVSEVTSIPGQSNWFKIWYQGVEGWVNSRYLSSS